MSANKKYFMIYKYSLLANYLFILKIEKDGVKTSWGQISNLHCVSKTPLVTKVDTFWSPLKSAVTK